jgi:hypothetical protein
MIDAMERASCTETRTMRELSSVQERDSIAGMLRSGLRRLPWASALYQGTTSVVPQRQQNNRWALAPEGFNRRTYAISKHSLDIR